jgi:hypothetical protein
MTQEQLVILSSTKMLILCPRSVVKVSRCAAYICRLYFEKKVALFKTIVKVFCLASRNSDCDTSVEFKITRNGKFPTNAFKFNLEQITMTTVGAVKFN